MNQPPPTETQTGKQIVSKGEYVRIQFKRYWGWLNVIVCFLCSFVLFYIIVSGLWHNFGLMKFIINLVLIMTAGIVYHVGKYQFRRTVALKNAVPLTRANTADLPAPDTLVRASAEPMQEPQTVLLRAATESVERHEEQLVRASAGGTE